MKKALLFFIFLISITALFGCTINRTVKQPAVTENAASIQKSSVSQKVTYDNKSVDYPNQEFTAGQTALDLVKQLPDVTIKGEGQNAYVTGITNRLASDQKKEYWSLIINNKPSEVGAGSYLLKSGDQIEWKLQNY